MSTTVKRKNVQPFPAVWTGILAVLVVAGIAAWVVQLTQGMSTTGIGQVVVWGIYIGTFFILAGTASGLLALAALGDLNVLPEVSRYRKDLLTASLAGYIAAGIVILMDIGHPERVLQFLFSPKFTSPFVWDFYALALAALVSAIYLFAAPKGKWMAWAAGFVAVAVVIVEGLLMSVTGARPLWHSALTPVLFVVESILTTAAAAYLLVADEKVTRTMVAVMRVFLPVLIGFTLVEAATVLYGGDTEATEAMRLLTSGQMAPLYWTQILAGIVLPFALLSWKGAGKAGWSLAAVLVMAGILLTKLNLLVAGQAYAQFEEPAAYAPSLVEAGGVIGAIAFALLLFTLGRRLLPAESVVRTNDKRHKSK